MPGMIQSGTIPFAVFANCPSSELGVGCCHIFTCILALSATYFGSFARRALVRSRTPMILCLSNARSVDLHFGISFVALRALVREIIPNTIHTHPYTGCPEKFDTQVFRIKIGNKHGMSKIQASLYSKLNVKASDVSYRHLH